ncbi:hypothetical protein HY948_00835 [Candidatus Gottesmanbacteria bacterium]|nr:hypothetical protein [Candidatus Gottesmanbacteria bacterium]
MSTKLILDTSALHKALTRHAEISEQKLKKHHPKAVSILEKAGVKPGKIRDHAAKLAATSAMAAALLFAQPVAQRVFSSASAKYASLPVDQLQKLFTQQLNAILPESMTPLTNEQEQKISSLIKDMWGITATASLQNERLNRSYGFIGAEQHLPRFPGDSIDQHGEPRREGITPGLGAWGYFAPSKDQLTQDLIEKEKWYVAVQTLYLPDWNTRFRYLRDWYQYRKVLVVNPINGKTVVADVADAGPADWTGKHFGGSPEVMAYLGLNVGMQKGPVILLFVDESNNPVPLGPVEYNGNK